MTRPDLFFLALLQFDPSINDLMSFTGHVENTFAQQIWNISVIRRFNCNSKHITIQSRMRSNLSRKSLINIVCIALYDLGETPFTKNRHRLSNSL